MKNSKRGMTLVELIISIAVTSLIIGAVVTVLFLGIREYGGGTREAQTHQTITFAESVLQNALKTASGAQLSAQAPALGEVCFSVQEEEGETILSVRQADGSVMQLAQVKTAVFSLVRLPGGSYQLQYELSAEDGYRVKGGTILNNMELGAPFAEQPLDPLRSLVLSYPA